MCSDIDDSKDDNGREEFDSCMCKYLLLVHI